MQALLNINLISALLDTEDAMHDAAQVCMGLHKSSGWARCVVTQNGFIRIMSQPAYPTTQPTVEFSRRLSEACNHQTHYFWDGGISLVNDEKSTDNDLWGLFKSRLPACWPLP